MVGRKAFKVRFDRDVSIRYSDERGQLKFVIDVGPSESPKAMFLYRKPVTTSFKELEPTESNLSWSDTAFQRARTFLESCGYVVTILDG